MSEIRYPIGEIVTFEGKQWVVISRYFNLRKIMRLNTKQEDYRTKTVEVLDEHNKPVSHLDESEANE